MTKEQIIIDFYQAFSNKDSQNMTKYYSNDIIFEDPAFGELIGLEASKMWEMLCHNAKDLKIECGNIKENNDTVTCTWKAHYTFSKTGRKVVNRINAHFTFKDDLIIKHQDSFDLKKWAHQALGFKAYLFAGSNFFKNKLQSTTKSQLKKYIEKFPNK